MPAMLDDPTAPVLYRTSGEPPYPTPLSPLPPDIAPRQVTLRDRVTTATLLPFSAPDQVPLSLLSYLCDQLNREIEKGDTYPMINAMPLESFGPYWFANFGAVMLLGEVASAAELARMARDGGRDWDKECLGSFYVKPNYPGRSSHVCNGGFLVTDGARNRGVGRLMGEGYLEWAPKLLTSGVQGYTYSVFNLVYETNVASCRIWDALGFRRIGRVKGCGNLRSYPDQLVDALIYGRDLGPDGDDYATEERFDKIRYYLKHGKYPNGADRAEKSRLRSAATHYKLIPEDDDEPEKLMLKGKEVISDPQRQYEIARTVHAEHHGGINKSTATIAEKYHWIRIKETVSQVIKNCPECKDVTKQPPALRTEASNGRRSNGASSATQSSGGPGSGGLSALSSQHQSLSNPPSPPSMETQDTHVAQQHQQHQELMPPLSTESHEPHPLALDNMETFSSYGLPVDPRLMEGLSPTFPDYTSPTQQSMTHYADPTPHHHNNPHPPQTYHHAHHHSQPTVAHHHHLTQQQQPPPLSAQPADADDPTKYLLQSPFTHAPLRSGPGPVPRDHDMDGITNPGAHPSADESAAAAAVAVQEAMLASLHHPGANNAAGPNPGGDGSSTGGGGGGLGHVVRSDGGGGAGPTSGEREAELTRQLMAFGAPPPPGPGNGSAQGGFGDPGGFGGAG